MGWTMARQYLNLSFTVPISDGIVTLVPGGLIIFPGHKISSLGGTEIVSPKLTRKQPNMPTQLYLMFFTLYENVCLRYIYQETNRLQENRIPGFRQL